MANPTMYGFGAGDRMKKVEQGKKISKFNFVNCPTDNEGKHTKMTNPQSKKNFNPVSHVREGE